VQRDAGCVVIGRAGVGIDRADDLLAGRIVHEVAAGIAGRCDHRVHGLAVVRNQNVAAGAIIVLGPPVIAGDFVVEIALFADVALDAENGAIGLALVEFRARPEIVVEAVERERRRTGGED
ncbi:hypothetical protein ABG067_009343, partial [Albugo candida]